MGSIVEHGCRPQSAFQMHPFFQTARPSLQPELPQPTHSLSSCNDGNSDVAEEDQGRPSASSDTGALKPSQSMPSPLHDSPIHEANAEADPNHDRRKRRKVTPSSEISIVNDLGQAAAYISAKQHDRLGNPGAPGREEKVNGSEDIEMTESQQFNSLAETRRSVRLSSAQQPESGLSPLSRQLTINLSPSKTRPPSEHSAIPTKTTPKKKMLRLSADGKLVRSPKRGPVSTHENNAAKKPSKSMSLKKGRIISSLKVALLYSNKQDEAGQTTGRKIDQIMSDKLRVGKVLQPQIPCQLAHQPEPKSSKATHPFFLGTGARQSHRDTKIKGVDESSTAQNSDVDSRFEPKKVTPWNEIKFSSLRPGTAKDPNSIAAPWPPLKLQSHGARLVETATANVPDFQFARSKQKVDVIRIPGTDDILLSLTKSIHSNIFTPSSVITPQRSVVAAPDLLKSVEERCVRELRSTESGDAIQGLKARLLTRSSAFDRGSAAGPQDWAHEYAPRKSSEVLQPQSRILGEWLETMKVHQVQSTLANAGHGAMAKNSHRRGRPKKKLDDMDDFIVSSEDEAATSSFSVKNAMLICGPHGCGKTASVYAAAAQLDFEVFEIHSGMRRGAKDIFDKVGDMTHNHLVQQRPTLSRESSVVTQDIDRESIEHEVASSKQKTMAGFMNKTKTKKRGKDVTASKTTTEDHAAVQKQSLILLEEVDNIFDDDKSFWPGVQALIQQSKRPIVLTCNSVDSLPLEELQLHATLVYDRPPRDDVLDYLILVAAAEGHLLDRAAVQTLYMTRGEDLRAALMDLHLWCQMTVGSKIGGLDWMHATARDSGSKGAVSRIVSTGTFHEGLDLIPELPESPEDILRYAQDQLGIPVLDWEALRAFGGVCQDDRTSLSRLEEALRIAEARSCMDVTDASIAATLSTAISCALPTSHMPLNRATLVQDVLRQRDQAPGLSRRDLLPLLEPLMEDFRTFPPTTGRTAPNLDGAGHNLATEVTPYIRSIVTFDQRLEQQRFELGGGSQSKRQRTTRAARAALEGGDKSNTRRERWFPKELDFDAVLRTGGKWAQYSEEVDSIPSRSQSPMEM